MFGEAVRRMFESQEVVQRITDFDSDITIYTDLSEHMQGQIFWLGAYSRDIIVLLKRTLSLGDVVIDCGANIGEISLVSAKQVGPLGKVYAFEPVKRLASILRRHADENNFQNITVMQAGAAGAPGAGESLYVG